MHSLLSDTPIIIRPGLSFTAPGPSMDFHTWGEMPACCTRARTHARTHAGLQGGSSNWVQMVLEVSVKIFRKSDKSSKKQEVGSEGGWGEGGEQPA